MKTHSEFMSLALKQASLAKKEGEIPVGAVIVKDGKVVASGRNTREATHSPLGHAELNAIEEASRQIEDWRLTDCTIYVTLEPCPMCASAIMAARIPNVVFGAYSEGGAVISKARLFKLFGANINVIGGVMREECEELMKDAFDAKA